MKSTASLWIGALAVAAAVASPAIADEKPTFAYSYNLGITSDYVFRGVSQTAERPTGQAGLDLSYGIFYAGLWGSGLDFGFDSNGRYVAKAEIDVYAGIKPVWKGITFDLGAIYYGYPGARDGDIVTATFDGELDYVELKAGASREIWKGGTLGSTYFFSPDYTNSTGKVFTSETTFAQVLPNWGPITPTVSALYGYQKGSSDRFSTKVANGDDNYSYWNAGLTLGWEKFTFDIRYWDTNIANDGLAAGFCKGTSAQCDERVVGTLKFTY